MVLGTCVSLHRCQGAEGHDRLLLFFFPFFFFPLEKQELRSCLPRLGELPALALP